MSIKKTPKKPTKKTVIKKIKAGEKLEWGDLVTIKNRKGYKVTAPKSIDTPLDPIEEAMEEITIPRGENVESEIVGETLSLRQEKFCRLYALDIDFMGNGVQAYLEVYNIDTEKKGWYKTACVCASQLLSNPKVYGRINDLLQENGLNDQFVDKQLLYVISQQADITNKVSAIKEYNKLKQRITDKIDTDVNIKIESINII